MASIPTHMLCGAAIGLWFARPPHVGRTMLVSACCAAIAPVCQSSGNAVAVQQPSIRWRVAGEEFQQVHG